MKVQPNHYDTVFWSSSLTASNEALFVHPILLELFVKSRRYEPGPSCWMIRYIDVTNARNSGRFSVKTPWNSGGIYHHHDRPLLL